MNLDKTINESEIISNMPLISVALPNFNHAKYLEDNFKGILDQTYEKWELIIVDDASTDHSKDIISRYASLDHRIKPVFLEKNGGCRKAYEVGIESASGKYVFAPAVDDYVCNNRFFERVAQAVELFPGVGGVFGQTSVVDGETEEHQVIVGGGVPEGYVSPDQAIVGLFDGTLFVHGVSSIWRTDILKDYFKIMSDLEQQRDYCFNHLIPSTHGAYYISEPCAVMRRISSSFSGLQDNDDYLIQMAKSEKHFVDIAGESRISKDMRKKWRLLTIGRRLRFNVQFQFINAARSFNPHSWEYDTLPERVVTARKWMLEQADAVELEMNAAYVAAESLFHSIAGKL